MAKKILVVIRTSTIQQELESQHNDMLSFLTEKGLGYKEEEIEWLEVAGASARSVNQEYLDMLDSIKNTITYNPSIKACAFWHLNRLGRWEKYIVDMKDWFISNHIQVYVKTPNLTLLNEDGSLDNGANIAWGVFASMVSYDTMEMMDKMKRGKDQAKKRGGYIGGFVATGFKVVDKTIVVDQEVMEQVKLVFEEYATGKWSYYKLQDELHSRDIPWTVRHLALLLQNPLYKEYVGEDLWNKCAEVRAKNNWNLSKESNHTRLGNKLIKCSVCGASYIADNGHYVCLNKKQGKRYGRHCTGMSVKVAVIDTLLWDNTVFLAMTQTGSNNDSAIAEVENEISVLQQKLEAKKNELAKTNKKIENNKILFSEAEISKGEYDKTKERLTGALARITTEIDNMRSLIESRKDTVERLKKPDMINRLVLMSKVGDVESVVEQRELVRKYIKEVLITRTPFKNREATLITINNNVGRSVRFIFDHNGSKHTKDMFSKLYTVNADGSTSPYSYTHRPLAETFIPAIKHSIEMMKDGRYQTYMEQMIDDVIDNIEE